MAGLCSDVHWKCVLYRSWPLLEAFRLVLLDLAHLSSWLDFQGLSMSLNGGPVWRFCNSLKPKESSDLTIIIWLPVLSLCTPSLTMMCPTYLTCLLNSSHPLGSSLAPCSRSCWSYLLKLSTWAWKVFEKQSVLSKYEDHHSSLSLPRTPFRYPWKATVSLVRPDGKQTHSHLKAFRCLELSSTKPWLSLENHEWQSKLTTQILDAWNWVVILDNFAM